MIFDFDSVEDESLWCRGLSIMVWFGFRVFRGSLVGDSTYLLRQVVECWEIHHEDPERFGLCSSRWCEVGVCVLGFWWVSLRVSGHVVVASGEGWHSPWWGWSVWYAVWTVGTECPVLCELLFILDRTLTICLEVSKERNTAKGRHYHSSNFPNLCRPTEWILTQI